MAYYFEILTLLIRDPTNNKQETIIGSYVTESMVATWRQQHHDNASTEKNSYILPLIDFACIDFLGQHSHRSVAEALVPFQVENSSI